MQCAALAPLCTCALPAVACDPERIGREVQGPRGEYLTWFGGCTLALHLSLHPPPTPFNLLGLPSVVPRLPVPHSPAGRPGSS